jgi:hypothetical protein
VVGCQIFVPVHASLLSFLFSQKKKALAGGHRTGHGVVKMKNGLYNKWVVVGLRQRHKKQAEKIKNILSVHGEYGVFSTLTYRLNVVN